MSPNFMKEKPVYHWALFLAGALWLGACHGDDAPVEPSQMQPSPDDSELAMSLKSKVKFKGTERLLNEFARTLALAPDQVCNEMGKYSCTDMVHRVPLGGTSAYDLALFKPLRFSLMTSPIATERVGLSACVARVDLDFAGDDAIIFADLDIDANGALADVNAESVRTAIDTLYKRALVRPVRETELEHLRQLYRDIASAEVDRPAREWAVLSCFVVMTTMEQLFY